MTLVKFPIEWSVRKLLNITGGATDGGGKGRRIIISDLFKVEH